MEWIYKDLQPTESGVERYEKLAELSAEELGPSRLREYQALQKVILKHPLDYIIKGRRGEPTQADFDKLIRKGYVIFVKDTYLRMKNLLEKLDPELLVALRTYGDLAYEQEVSEAELDEALSILERRVREQEPWSVKDWEEKVGVPTTKSEKREALHMAVHLAHYDPDMLRRLPKREQSLVGGSILGWLEELSGEEVGKWERM